MAWPAARWVSRKPAAAPVPPSPADRRRRSGLLLLAGRPGFLLARYEAGGSPRCRETAGAASSVLWPARQPACVHGGARGTGSAPSSTKGRNNDQVCLPGWTALSRHPRMLLALPAAVLAVTLAACGSSGGQSAHPAAPKPPSCGAQSYPFRAVRTRAAGHHAAGAAGHRATTRRRAAGHRPGPYRQSDPAGQRRRP